MGLFINRIDRLLENLEGETDMTVDIFTDAEGFSPQGDSLNVTGEEYADGYIGDVGVLVASAYAGAGVSYPNGNRDWFWEGEWDIDVEGADIIFHTDSSRILARFLGEPNHNGGLYAGTAVALDFEWWDRGDDPVDIYVPGYTDGFGALYREFREDVLALGTAETIEI